MARSGAGRGTRMGRGILSGTTLATIPSGVTADVAGIAYDGTTYVTPTELGYLDGQAGYGITYGIAGYEITGGSTRWQGVSEPIAHGFSTLTGFVATYGVHVPAVSGNSSPLPVIKTLKSPTAGVVTAVVVREMAETSSSLLASGGTIFWLAFGT